jgi:hypothetical protein
MISIKDLGMAYRKAKADLYYSSHASLNAIAKYEENLHTNLSALLVQINGDEESWVTLPDFIGTWTVATKSVKMGQWKTDKEKAGNGLIFSSPAEEWKHICRSLADLKPPLKPEAEFRVMANCSLDFHVLSTLWILKVGHLFDAQLTDCAKGNRLRRTHNGQKINELSLGSFEPYFMPFRTWRDNGINAMRTALNAGKKIVALTADVTSFYHELNPKFMLDPAFVKDILKLALDPEQGKLHRLFIKALVAWAAKTPLKKGLPVGLPASAVVANMALIDFDRAIAKQVVPLYYGRYVDDILLVMENGANFKSTEQLWEWLYERSDGNLVLEKESKKSHINIAFQPTYLEKCETKLYFANAKNKVFMLEGDSGKTLVDAIEHQIHERASEWRAMPRLPRSPSHVGTNLLAATQSDGEAADNLRKADALTMRRAGFAIKLRDFEAFERDLNPDAWKEHRRAFFRAFTQHVLVLPQFFDLAVYLPRVIRLATACEDFRDLRKIINAVAALCKQVKEDCTISVKACSSEILISEDELITKWQAQLFNSVLESITAAFTPRRLSKASKQAWEEHMADWHEVLANKLEFLSRDFSVRYYQTQQARLFSFDLAHMPFRFIGLPSEMIAQRGIPAKKTVIVCGEAATLLPDRVLAGTKLLTKWIKFKRLPNGVLFATRPFNLPELYILNKDAYFEQEQTSMGAVVLALRGFNLNEKTPCFDKNGVLQIPDGTLPHKIGIAVSSLETRPESWVAAVTRAPDPDVERYARLNQLLNSVIAQPKHSRYLILPELALPAHWFIRIARKLQARGISLITGIEYLHAGKSRVRSQVWAALSHGGLGFPSIMIYRQDKQRPALNEDKELKRLAGLDLIPESPWEKEKPPIVQHGEFRFAMLVCSELTNISYRAALRGKVDAVFVPEWNKDTETFNSLVESAALDVHAYIIQCNNRRYGDSRIRAPFQDSWKRDVLRVKGGVTDYCVIGEIDVKALRQFQSSKQSPGTPFKPVPDGFKESMDNFRKLLPVGNADRLNEK